jgi:hypothetical protein
VSPTCSSIGLYFGTSGRVDSLRLDGDGDVVSSPEDLDVYYVPTSNQISRLVFLNPLVDPLLCFVIVARCYARLTPVKCVSEVQRLCATDLRRDFRLSNNNNLSFCMQP